jgi:hypothetical protein
VDASAIVEIEPPSPASQYTAQRVRARRQQTTIAIVLLLAVIVLAGVLIWVLQRGPAVSDETAMQQSDDVVWVACFAPFTDAKHPTVGRHTDEC